MKKFEGSIDEFLAKITHKDIGYLKKSNGKKVMGFWWSEEIPEKHHWIMVGRKNLNAKEFEEVSTALGKDIKDHIDYYLRQGYEMYL